MTEIIARGKLVSGGFLGADPTLWLASGEGDAAVLIDIIERLGPYIGQAIVISLEEEEPVLNDNLKELLVEA